MKILPFIPSAFPLNAGPVLLVLGAWLPLPLFADPRPRPRPLRPWPRPPPRPPDDDDNADVVVDAVVVVPVALPPAGGTMAAPAASLILLGQGSWKHELLCFLLVL